MKSGLILKFTAMGSSMLAEVDNARVAIHLKDGVAASNDVAQAQYFARRLPDRPSKLLLSEHPPAMTGSGALVQLGSAQGSLSTGNLEAADSDLRAIQTAISDRSDQPLLRAAASLDIARSAASEGRAPEITTQLLTAQMALNANAEPGSAAGAKALAEAIGKALNQASVSSGVILPNQVSLWLGQVVEWAGGARGDDAPSESPDH
jgi:hypothetical protein